jgi:hypothetical protein
MIRKKIFMRALNLVSISSAVAFTILPSAMAQSNAAGIIFGGIDGGADSLVLLNTDAGSRRIVTADGIGIVNTTSIFAP